MTAQRLLVSELWLSPPPAVVALDDEAGGDLLLVDRLADLLEWLELCHSVASLVVVRTVGHAVVPRSRLPSRGSGFGPDFWAAAQFLPHRPRVFYPEWSNVVAFRPRVRR